MTNLSKNVKNKNNVGSAWGPVSASKNPEKGRGLGHVTLVKYGIASNVSPKRVKLWTSNLVYSNFSQTNKLHYGNVDVRKTANIKHKQEAQLLLGDRATRKHAKDS